MDNQKRKAITGLFLDLATRNLSVIPKIELITSINNSWAIKFLRRKSEGIETCYHGFYKGSEIIVCITHSDFIDDLKKNDTGWVLLINKNSKEPFFSFPIRRVKNINNYCNKILAWVDCMIEIAMNWPKIPGTDLEMKLVRVKGVMHMRRFIPPGEYKTYPRRKPYFFWIVEMDLTPQNSNFLNRMFKNFYRYRKLDNEKRLAIGKEPRRYQRLIRYESKHKKELKNPQKGVYYEKNDYTDTEPDYDLPQ